MNMFFKELRDDWEEEIRRQMFGDEEGGEVLGMGMTLECFQEDGKIPC